MTTPAMSDQRRHPRYDIRLSADVRAGTRSFTATTRNLSAGGCCLEGHYPLEEESEVALDLFIVVDGIEDATMPSLAVRGTVQWVAPSDEPAVHVAGVRFVGMTPAQQRWLEEFLARTGHE